MAIEIDEKGAIWAYNLGRIDRLNPNFTLAESWTKVCPFRPGIPHRVYWYRGWIGGDYVWPTTALRELKR